MKGPSITPSENPVQLRAALSLSGNGIMLFDCLRTATGAIQDFRLVLANRKAEEMAGMSESDMFSRISTDLFPGTAATGIWEHAKQVVETGTAYETEIRHRLPNQPHEGWYALTLQRYGDGLAVSFSDITTIKQQTAFVESVLNGSINGMIAYEAVRDKVGKLYDLRIRLANDAAARITGTPIDRMVGNTVISLFPIVHESGLFARYAHTIETGEAQRFESQYTLDGQEGWYDISVAKFGDGMLMTFIDITTVKRHEEDLNKLIENLQRSNQNLERFAYVASHDLQEPLRKILSFGDILRNQPEGAVSDHSAGLIERMQSAAGRMNKLIQDLLTFSRLSTQQQPFRRINLQELVSEVLTDLEMTIQSRRARIDVTNLPIIVGDAMQLRQVFQNLLSNALKFVKPATLGETPVVRIDCERITGHLIQPLPGQSVAASDIDRLFFAISVEDNGIGFDEKYLNRMFTIFQRLHTRTEYEGTGIGLTIVQKVIDNHKGYIGACSQPGKGATFRVYLPAIM